MRAFFRVADCPLPVVSTSSACREGKALIPFMRVPPSCPDVILTTSQRPHLLTASRGKKGFQHRDLGRIHIKSLITNILPVLVYSPPPVYLPDIIFHVNILAYASPGRNIFNITTLPLSHPPPQKKYPVRFSQLIHDVFLQLVSSNEDRNKSYVLPLVDNVSEICLSL